MAKQYQYNDITIPRGNLKEKFWAYVERITTERSIKLYLWQSFIFGLFSGFPSILGSVIRGTVYRSVLGSLGSDCLIERNVRLIGPKRIFVGDRVFIGLGSYFDAGLPEGKIYLGNEVKISQQVIFRVRWGKIVVREGVNIGDRAIIRGSGGVEIGRNSLIANQVQIIAANHIYQNPKVPIRLQGGRGEKIVLGEDVWLGASVIVLPGVTVGNGSVIGAGSVVTRDIPSCSIAAGSPAKVIRKRE